MPKQSGYVIWNDKELMLQVKDASIDLIDQIGLRVIAVSQPPVDTGFMDASAYVNSQSGLNTFNETWQNGQYVNRQGKLVDRRKLGEPEPPPANGAVVGWAAIYALFVEADRNFIYTALQQVAAENER
jgi:hypothetical protein